MNTERITPPCPLLHGQGSLAACRQDVQLFPPQARNDIFQSSDFLYLVANIALREENVAASSFKAFSSFRSFIIVSVTIAFSFSYLLFKLARATSAVYCLPRRTEM